MKQELLHAPVEDLGDVQLVLRRACNFVNPAELLRLLPCLAEDAEQLSVERDLIYTSRKRVGGVEHLVRTWGDANRPGRAGAHRSRRRVRPRRVANRGLR